MAKTEYPKGEQEPKVPMISAKEAHSIAEEARRAAENAEFAESGYAAMIASVIRDHAKRGENNAVMLVPAEIAYKSIYFLTAHGYRVNAQQGMTGVALSVEW